MKFHLNICLGAFALVLAGCNDAERNSGVEGVAKSDSRNLKAQPTQDDLYAPLRVLELAIEIAPEQLKALRKKEDTHEYVPCVVQEGEQSWDQVGVHCRGHPAKELATGKPDLILTFDKLVSKQRFHGQRRIVLQASREDPSYLTAPIALEMFQAARVPAPRFTFARVRLNGSALGFYVVIEGVEREFLKRHFKKTSGNLYDEGDPPDVTGKLEKARGRDRNDQSDVDALAAAALQPNPDERWQQLQERLDMDRFLKFTALEILLWLDDSYALEAHKFRLYHDPKTDRMVFFPKNVERVLQKTNGPAIPQCRGVVARAVLSTKEGQQRYRETVANLLETVFNPTKVQGRVQELSAIVRPAAVGDATSAQAFDRAVREFLNAVARRAEFVATQLQGPPDGERQRQEQPAAARKRETAVDEPVPIIAR